MRRSIIAALLVLQAAVLYGIVACTLQLGSDLGGIHGVRLSHVVRAAERSLAFLHVHRDRRHHG